MPATEYTIPSGQTRLAAPPARCHTLTKQLPQVRCEVLQGTEHPPNLKQPERFNRALPTFCELLPPCVGH